MQGEKNILNRIGLKAKALRIKFLEWRYALHIRARYIHDTTYQKGGCYKGGTDKPYSNLGYKAAFQGLTMKQSLICGRIQS